MYSWSIFVWSPVSPPPPPQKKYILSKDSASSIFRHPFLQNTILNSRFGKGNPKFLVSIQCTCQVQVFWNSSDRSEPQVAKVHGLLQEVAVEFGTASSHGSLTGQTNFATSVSSSCKASSWEAKARMLHWLSVP